jgi:hypothetical protein
VIDGLLRVVNVRVCVCVCVCVAGSISTVFNQADVHGTSLSNVNGQCDLTAMVRYDKTGNLPLPLCHSATPLLIY